MNILYKRLSLCYNFGFILIARPHILSVATRFGKSLLETQTDANSIWNYCMNVSLHVREDVRTRGPLVVDVLVYAVPAPTSAQLTLPSASTDGLSKCDRCEKLE